MTSPTQHFHLQTRNKISSLQWRHGSPAPHPQSHHSWLLKRGPGQEPHSQPPDAPNRPSATRPSVGLPAPLAQLVADASQPGQQHPQEPVLSRTKVHKLPPKRLHPLLVLHRLWIHTFSTPHKLPVRVRTRIMGLYRDWTLQPRLLLCPMIPLVSCSLTTRQPNCSHSQP